MHGERSGDARLKTILDASFRASPDYELVPKERLTAEQQKFLADLEADEEFYGILTPRREGLTLKSVNSDTALLLYSLQQPGKIPRLLLKKLGQEGNHSVAELVLDGILEIEHNGEFVSGPGARSALFVDSDFAVGSGAISQLSLEALKYAQLLESDDVAQVSMRLYFYNRLPASPEWTRKLPHREAVANYLGLRNGREVVGRLKRDWEELHSTEMSEVWFIWKSRQLSLSSKVRQMVYKLYISPAVEQMKETFAASLNILRDAGAFQFKIGNNLYGLLRPDKFVVYFPTFEQLSQAALQLQSKLEGHSAHGVPFTAEISADGLLSWGIDPPHEADRPQWLGPESWRMWVTNHLAAAIVSAKREERKDVAPWRYALERLQLEGVNITNWSPTETMRWS